MKHSMIKLFTLGILLFPLTGHAANQVIDYSMEAGDELHLCVHQTADYSFSTRNVFLPSAIAEGLPALVPDSMLGVLPVGGPDGAMIFYNNETEVRTKDVLFYAILAAPRLQAFFNQDHQEGPAPYVMVKSADRPNPCAEGEEIPGGWIIRPQENITPLQVTQVTAEPQDEAPPAPEPNAPDDPIDAELDPQALPPAAAATPAETSGGCSLSPALLGGSNPGTLIWLTPLWMALAGRFCRVRQ